MDLIDKITTTPEIEEALENDSPVAVGVSGGKDSSVLALVLNDYLDSVGHAGDRILIHSDLGRTEWAQSLPKCQELADRLGWPLHVVKRNAGDMLDRWRQRWNSSVERYESLSCVKLILPWSTASMRFCTAELKRDVICSKLKKLYSNCAIINAVGIRREESPNRAKSKISKPQPKLLRKRDNTSGLDWNPILDFTMDDVLEVHRRYDFPLHEAYTKWGVSRVSCSFCILASRPDLLASSKCPTNQDVYRQQVSLEIESAFAFQGESWLGDVAPNLLWPDTHVALKRAKEIKAERELIESDIPKELLYVKGWPTRPVTESEAKLIASVRSRVNQLQGLNCDYLCGPSVRNRYDELIAAKSPKKPVDVFE